MKKIIVIQLSINIIFIIISILVALGKLVDIKYNFDDTGSNSNSVECSNSLYSYLLQYNTLIAIIIVSNIFLSYLLFWSLRKNN